jgi:predicted RNase H-like HicB family nuclease
VAKYVYPALLEPNELGGYCVAFPDVQGAYTEGKTLAEAIEMAQDALCLMMYNHEEHNSKISPPTAIGELTPPVGGVATLVACDTNHYKRYFANKSVKKTVTIPARLNYEAEQAGVNFSVTLQNALREQLQLK